MEKNKLHVFINLLACTLLISACNSKDSIPSKNNTNISGNSLNNINTEKYNFAIKTSEGIVWSPSPEPFSFYLSSPNEKTLRIDKAKKLFTLPLHDGKANLVVDEVFGLGDYIIYHTSSVFSDGAQPLRQQAWVMRIDNPTSNKEILEFHSTGGKSYSYAVDEKERLYVSVSVIPGNADGSDSYEVYVYNISTDKKEKIQIYSLKPSIDSIRFTYNEKKYSYKLHAK
jgi:hypothetical protein